MPYLNVLISATCPDLFLKDHHQYLPNLAAISSTFEKKNEA